MSCVQDTRLQFASNSATSTVSAGSRMRWTVCGWTLWVLAGDNMGSIAGS